MKHSLSVRRAVFGVAAIACSLTCFNSAQAQDSRWAPADDPTVKLLINWERQWAEAGCNHNGIERTILAEDFHGTSPSGTLYSKQEALAESQQEKTSEEACTLYAVKVHFFGDSMAILYGSESAIHTEADGRRHTVKLTWTDTWLKRHGTWQIVAAQDMPTEMK
jgi:Domain of unknown function (DUF4440)